MEISWFSCGVPSAVAAYLSPSSVPYYIHINSADPDNWRFMADCEQWLGRYIVSIQSARYKDQHDVARQEKYINGPTGAACTLKLKKEVRYYIQESLQVENQIFGFTLEEAERWKRFKYQNPEIFPVAPLIHAGMTKKDCFNFCPVKPPAMYQSGYLNNNCIGCVKGGKSYWNKIRREFPDQFQRMVETENIVGHSCINGTKLSALPKSAGRRIKAVRIADCNVFCNPE